MTVLRTAVSLTGKIFCALLLLIGLFRSPAFGDSWARAYGSADYEQASAVEQTADGGYVIAGVTWSFGAGNDDAWIVKTDQNGTVQWQKAFGGSDFDEFSAIQQTADGGFIAAGVTGSFGAGSGDAWVLKLDSAGSVQWQKTYGGSGYDEARSIRKTADGGYIMAGKTSSFGSGGEDAWILKLSVDGTVQWQKTLGGGLADSVSGTRETSDGGFVAAGVTWSSGAGGDALIAKLDSGGVVQWQKTLGGSGYDEFNAVQQTGDGGLIAAGMTGSFGAGNGDLWVVRFDATGNVQWQKTYGGSLVEWANAVYPASDGGFITAGITFSSGVGNGDLWVLRLDTNGNVLWQKTYGSGDFDEALAIQQTSDSGFVVAGSTWSSGATFYDAWVLKLDSSGSVASCSTGFAGTSSMAAAASSGALNTVSLSVLATAVSGQASGSSATSTTAVVGDACTYVEPNISVSPAEIDFGPVSVPTSSQEDVTISNRGTTNLVISGVGISGAGAGAFSQTNSCTTLSAGSSCIVTVTFTPSAETAYAANLNISSNDPDTGTTVVSLIGTGMAKMPVPASQEGYIYSAVSVPLINTAPAQARPFGVGSMHTGTLSLRVGFPVFTGPVDIYLAIFAPSVSPEVWMIKPDLNLQPLSSDLVAWKTGTTGPVDEALYGDIALNLLPPGTYTLYVLVTPAGSLGTYYLWSTSFNVSATPAMAVPVVQAVYTYPAVANPVLDTNPTQARPFGVGDIGSGTLSLRVGFPVFTGPVDIYLAIYAPSVSPEIWMIKPDLNLQPLSGGLIAWRTDTTGPVDEALYGDIALNLLPPGTYTLYTLVTPAGSLETYYLWSTSFNTL